MYSSPEVYRLEQERIFRGPIWSFVAMEAEIPLPNDFKSTFVGDAPVVATRDADVYRRGSIDAPIAGQSCAARPVVTHGA